MIQAIHLIGTDRISIRKDQHNKKSIKIKILRCFLDEFAESQLQRGVSINHVKK